MSSSPPEPAVAVGDRVVTMSYPGLFIVLDVKGEDVTIGNAEGQKRVVRAANLRRVNRTSDAAP